MISHHRDITDFLSRHGATLITIEPGGKHPKVDFTFQGKPFSVPVAASPSDPNATNAAIHGLKKMLGDAITGPEKTPRKLEDMLPPPKEQPRYMGAMAMYATGSTSINKPLRMRFLLPTELAVSLNLAGQIMAVSRLGKDTWRLSPQGMERHNQYRSRVRKDHQQYLVDSGDRAITAGYNTFGASLAEYIVVDNDIVVHLDSANIKPLEKRKNVSWPSEEPKMAQTEPPPVPPVPPPLDPSYALPPEPAVMIPPAGVRPIYPDPNGQVVAMDEYLLAILRAITRMEKITFHRLTRVRKDSGESAWVWRAPDIRLDE